MSLIKKLGALMLIVITFVCAVSLTSCGSNSGVDASMTAVSTATRVTITATFGTNKNLKSGDAVPHVKQYKYNSETDKYDYDNVDLQLSFSSNVYTTSKQTFTGLDESTKYMFKLYITYKSKDKKEAQVEIKTKASDEATEISTIDEFNAMSDDPSGDYILTADLDFDDLTDSSFSSPFNASTKFTGTFNGNGHTLSNIVLPSGDSNIGVFGYTSKATIFDLKIVNVSADFTSGRASADMGAVVGHATNTVLYNVTVDTVDFDIQGNSTATINIGGLVGLSEGSTFINCEAKNVDINFTRLRCKVSMGGLVGQAIKYSNESISSFKDSYDELIEAATKAGFEQNDSKAYLEAEASKAVKDEKILAYDCTAQGKLGGVLYYLSKTDSGDAFAHVGGFAGDISTTNLVYDCVANANIELTRNESTSNDNRFSLACGGFFGINYTGTVRIKSSLADSIINVYAGTNPTNDDSLTQEEKEEKLNDLLDTVLCVSKDITVDSDKNLKEPQCEYAYVGCFGGKVSEFISVIEDCVCRYVDGTENAINVYAAEYRALTDKELEILDEDDSYKSLSEGTVFEREGKLYIVTSNVATKFYELDVLAVELTEEQFNNGTYYTYDADNAIYVPAVVYDEATEYYDIEASLAEVNESTDFDSNNYYIISDDSYYQVFEYLPNEVTVKVIYLYKDSSIAFIDQNQETRIGTIDNIDTIVDTTIYGDNVKEYLTK